MSRVFQLRSRAGHPPQEPGGEHRFKSVAGRDPGGGGEWYRGRGVREERSDRNPGPVPAAE